MVKSLLSWFAELIAALNERTRFMYVIFVMIYIIAAYKLWFFDVKFWYQTDPGEIPEPPPFLENYFWVIIGASALATLFILAFAKYLTRFADSFTPVNYLIVLLYILGFIAVLPLALGVIFLILYFLLIGIQLLIALAAVLFIAYWSAVLGDELIKWVGFK